tara:strand:+ start:3753 stop:4502 length:750 start_codon:yes stop_codon:yes gene_type:complete
LQKPPKSITSLIIFLSIFLSAVHSASSSDKNDPNIKFLQNKLKEIIPSYKIDKIKKSPVDNIYEVIYGGEIVYITSDAEFIFESGNLQKIIKDGNSYYFKNITEKSASEGRKNLLASIPDSKLFVYGDSKENYINVVTDIDCPYCRKFHEDIPIYLKNGVKVRYLVFSIKTSSKNKVVSAWCAKDKNIAFTLLKNEEKIPKKNCDSPIEEHQKLISSIGVSSTPSIFLSDGTLIQGYMSPEEIIERIKN